MGNGFVSFIMNMYYNCIYFVVYGYKVDGFLFRVLEIFNDSLILFDV